MKIWILHRADLCDGARIVGMWDGLPSAQQVKDAASEDIDIEVAHTVIDSGQGRPYDYTILELEQKELAKGQYND